MQNDMWAVPLRRLVLETALPPNMPSYGPVVCHRGTSALFTKLHLIQVSNYSLLPSPVASQIRKEAKLTLPIQLAEWASPANDREQQSAAALLPQEALRSAGSPPPPPSQMRRFKKDFCSWVNYNINYFKGYDVAFLPRGATIEFPQLTCINAFKAS